MEKNIPLPVFSKQALLFSIILIILPNIIFLVVAWLTSTARPIINLDYVLCALLLTSQRKWLCLIGALCFIWATIFDSLMFVMQLFPFMDLNGALYLTPFLLKAPVLYRILAGVLIAYGLLTPYLLQRIAAKTNFYHVMLMGVTLCVLSYFTGIFQYYHSKSTILFGRDNFYYIKSQFKLYSEGQALDFLKAAHTKPIFTPLTFNRAAKNLIHPDSHKILFIVNESWGSPTNQALQNAVLQNLQHNPHIQNWQEGHFSFVGATVQGEMRELCNTEITGFNLRLTPAQQLQQCLPHYYAAKGYFTEAIHGATGQMYDRFSWYPKAGFQKTYFSENFPNKPRCQAFNGVCDSALFNVAAQAFSEHDKLFFYWMTLTTHSTYDETDLFDKRLHCAQYGFPDDATLCRNFRLQAQFFDGLSKLIEQPQMKGTEVIVVGDHSPPTTNLGEVFKYMNQGHVAWIHFTVK